MARYTFTCEHFEYNNFTGDELDVASKHTTEFRADDLSTMLENFEMFLRGAGFHFDGVIDVVKPDDIFEQDLDAIDDLVKEQQSKKVMEHIVADLMKNNQKESEYSINLDNMNNTFVSGSSDWNVGAAMPTLAIDDIIKMEDITIDFSDLSGKCEVCSLPKNVMSVHKCYDDNCPLYAAKN